MKEISNNLSQVKALTDGLENKGGIWKNPERHVLSENVESSNSVRIVDLSKYLMSMETVADFAKIKESDKRQSIVLYNGKNEI